MVTWDRRPPGEQAKVRDARLRAQLRDRIGPFSPYWRERFAALRVPASSITNVEQLRRLPAVGERDVCPDGDPAGMARLVVQADEEGYALHAWGPDLRRALVRRALGRAAYRRQVEAEIRPTTYHFAGRTFAYPVASTRQDLDLVARAGNRAWQVLGLTTADVLVSAIPVSAKLEHQFLSFAALGAGAPALFPGGTVSDVAAAIRLVRPTVLATRTAEAAAVITGLTVEGVDLSSLRTVLLVGHPADGERTAAAGALAAAGVTGVAVLALYGPSEGRVLWPECRAAVEFGGTTGYHTYPDLDFVELTDPESGEPASGAGEITVTQLGFAGTALLRWRTGDVALQPVATDRCPACKRTVPRIPAQLQVAPLQPWVLLRGRPRPELVDLRAVAGALAGRTDIADWRITLAPSRRDRTNDLLVFVTPTAEESETAVAVYRDVRAASGINPTQIVVTGLDELAVHTGDGAAPRIVIRR